MFDAAGMTEVNTSLHWDAETRLHKRGPLFSESGAVLTGSSLRLFEIPDPFRPMPAAPVSYAIDLALDGSGRVSLISAPGVVVTAGLHGLRLDAGKLYETSDGWATWFETAPPPTGAPRDLGGATCDERGCLLGPWARIGWERPARTPAAE